MTFLEFVTERLMGPPTSCRGNGESCWPCPKCDHARFHTRPHKPPHVDKFNCWRCDFWGDEMDLLKHFYPADDYGQRRDRLHQLWQEYRAEHVSDAFSLPGLGSVTVPVARSIGDYVQKRCPDFESWSNVMSLIQVALEICAEHRCDPLELAATIGMDNTAEILKQQWAQTDDRTPLEVLRDLGTAKEVMA